MKVFNTTYNLGSDPYIYFLILHDVRGNLFQPILGYIYLYRLNNDVSLLDKYKQISQNGHMRLDEIMEEMIIIMKKEDVKGRLFDLINRLKKASNFDWSDKNKFDKFCKVYDKILKKLKK